MVSLAYNYQLVTKFIEIEMIDTVRDAGDEDDDINYHLINDELHKCISAAKDIPNKSYNSEEVELVSESTNSD